MPSRQMIVKIHVGKNQLGMSDEEYRSILARNFGVRSSAELTEAEAQRLVNEIFKARGFSVKRPANSRRPGRDISGAQAPRGGEVFYHKSSLAGLRAEIAEYALRRFGPGWERPLGKLCERIAGIERLEWVNNFYHLKAIKAALLKMEEKGPYRRGGFQSRPSSDSGYVVPEGDPF